MSVEEAIERIKYQSLGCNYTNCKFGHDCTLECLEAIKMAVEALENKKDCIANTKELSE